MNSVKNKEFVSRTLRELGVQEQFIESECNNILIAYSESGRYYHTINHIRSTFDAFMQIIESDDEASFDPSRLKAAKIAILYHDFVYDTTSHINSNEEMSADELLRFTQRTNCLNIEELGYAIQLINSTSNHVPEDDYPETLAFLDADMSVLAQPREIYLQHYAAEIRKEWLHISDATFIAGRMLFLRKSLESPRLFYTNFMFGKEEQARNNIKYELNLIDHRK